MNDKTTLGHAPFEKMVLFINRIVKYRGKGLFGKHDIPTLIPMLEVMCNDISEVVNKEYESNILVWDTVELAFYLSWKGFNNISIARADASDLHPKRMEMICNEYGYDYIDNIWSENMSKKFDVITGNSPFSTRVVNDESKKGKKVSLWQQVVRRSFEVCKPGGTVALVHPNGWRDIGDPTNIWDFYSGKEITHVKMYDVDDGGTYFGKNVGKFDYVVSKNRSATESTTNIVDAEGAVSDIDIANFDFIPSAQFDEIQNLIAQDGEESVELITDWSTYETRKFWMNEERTDRHIYPCVYTVKKKELNCWYSSENKGHFGIPKVIFSNGGGTTVFFDENGNYGLTQFARGIVDSVENLEHVYNAMLTPRFMELMKKSSCSFNKYDYKLIGLLRKDFWKQFV